MIRLSQTRLCVFEGFNMAKIFKICITLTAHFKLLTTKNKQLMLLRIKK